MTFTFQTLPGGTPVTKSLADWGIGGLRLTRRHFPGDEARFTLQAVSAFAAGTAWDLGATGLEHRCWFTDDAGAVIFVGYIAETPFTSDGHSESREFVIKGVGHLLSRLVFHQQRKIGFFPTPSLGVYADPHVWLGQNASGSYVNNGQQLDEIVSYAEGKWAVLGHDFQHDVTGWPTCPLLLDENTGITCEQAVSKMLAHSPDNIAWWDYSTLASGLPKPTLRIGARGSLTNKQLAANSGRLKCSPRYDLLTRAVCIKYETTYQLGNETALVEHVDAYPATLDGAAVTGTEAGVLTVTVPLQGTKAQPISGAIVCADVKALDADDGLRVAWWLNQQADLRASANGAAGLAFDNSGNCSVPVVSSQTYFFDPGNATSVDVGSSNYTSGTYFATGGASTVTLHGPANAVVTAFVGRVTINQADCTRSGTQNFPRYLAPGSGGLAPWMGFGSEEVQFTAKAFVVDNTGGHYQLLTVPLMTTDATTGTYATCATLSVGEPVPSGLAQAYFNSLSTLHWQGEMAFEGLSQTYSLLPDLGQTIGLTGTGGIDLTGAQMLVYEIELDVFADRTTVRFGHPQHVSIGDLVDQLRALRMRQLWTLPSAQNTGVLDNTTGALPSASPVQNSGRATANLVSLQMQHPDPGGSGVTQQVSAALADLPTGTTAKWRETFAYNTVSGSCVLQRCYVLRTDWVNV